MTPEYKKLAYERAVLNSIIRLAKDHYLPKEGADDPELDIDSEDLARIESRVPTENITEVILKLQNLATSVADKMRRFQFVEVESTYESAWKQEKERPSESSPAAPAAPGGKGAGKGGKGGSKAPAHKRG